MNYLFQPASAEPMLVRGAKSNWRAVNFVVVRSVDMRTIRTILSKLSIIKLPRIGCFVDDEETIDMTD